MSPDLVPWLAALAFFLGLLALVLEIFVIPGFGVAGIAGIILIGWGILLLSVDVVHAFKALVVALLLSVILFFLGIKFMSKINFWQKITLGARQYKEAGYMAPREGLGRYAGMEGVAVTPLHPAGTVEVNGERLDVVSEGGYIPAGTKIRIARVEGGRITVRPLQ